MGALFSRRINGPGVHKGRPYVGEDFTAIRNRIGLQLSVVSAGIRLRLR
jgi:hypothetical protein